MVGLIGAMAVELEQLKAQMENLREEKIGMDELYTGTLFGQEVVLAVCGPGKVNAALCAQSMILRHHPRWILNLGVAGAGEAGVSIGDMVVASCTVQHDMDTSPIGDPVGYVSKIGLVEIPCVKRNVIGAVNALSASDMALAGIRSVIPPDEVIDAMRNVGDVMSVDLRETGRGGLAGTPTGQAIFEQLQKR